MILYFTGTGNSEYAAKKLAAALGEETMPLMERIRHNDTSPLESETPWIVCTPTYAWQLPHIVRDHLRRTLLRVEPDGLVYERQLCILKLFPDIFADCVRIFP